MSIRVSTTMVLLVACLATVAVAQEAAPSRPWGLAFGAGLVNQSLGDANDYVKARQQDIQNRLSMVQDTKDFGWGWEILAEGNKQISDTVVIGIVGSYCFQKPDTKTSSPRGIVVYDPEVQLVDVSARVRYLITSTPGLYVAANAGMAFGTFKELVSQSEMENPADNGSETSEYTGSGLSLGAAVGHLIPISPGARFGIEFGYRYRDLGTMDGWIHTDTGVDNYEGPALDMSGNELNFNFSGIYVDASIVLLFGA